MEAFAVFDIGIACCHIYSSGPDVDAGAALRDHFARDSVDQLGLPSGIKEQHILPIRAYAGPGIKLVVALLFPKGAADSFSLSVCLASYSDPVQVGRDRLVCWVDCFC